MIIKIAESLKNLPTVDYRQLIPFQKNLKDLSEKDYKRLLKSLTEFGFIVPIFIWKKDGKNFILDAHQRCRVLTKENIEPYELPYVEIEAETEQEAKKKLLVISSQYGKITQEGMDEFAFNIDDGWLKETTKFDALFKDFKFDLPENNKKMDKERLKDKKNECPNCGYKL